jgi:hypothetical protein
MVFRSLLKCSYLVFVYFFNIIERARIAWEQLKERRERDRQQMEQQRVEQETSRMEIESEMERERQRNDEERRLTITKINKRTN